MWERVIVNSSNRLTAGIIAFFSLVVAFLMGVAINNPPDWMKPYQGLAWIPLLPSMAIFIYMTARAIDPPAPFSEVDSTTHNDFVRVVNEAENLTRSDPALENVREWLGKLEDWKERARALMNIIGVGIGDQARINWKPNKKSKDLVQLALRITKVIILTMSLRDQDNWKYQIDLTHSVYIIHLALKEWLYAGEMAYEIAQTYYDHGQSVQAQEWTNTVEKLLNTKIQVNSSVSASSSAKELRARYLDIKGLLLRELDGEFLSARQCFKEALNYCRASNPLYCKITTHLGTLEKQENHLQEAADLYNKALDGATQLKDVRLKLDCYQVLGDLAFSQGQFDVACEWHRKQLNEAEAWHIIYKSRAYQGLAIALIKKAQPDIEHAYQNAHEARKIERDITHSKEKQNEIHALIADIAEKLFAKYCPQIK
jgi:tetratricopeptide (TPR) repeat protein